MMKFIDRLTKLGSPVFFFRCLALKIAIAHVSAVLCICLFTESYCNVSYFGEEPGLLIVFITSVIGAPLLETFLFQYLFFEIGEKFLKLKGENLLWVVLLSAAVFGFQHSYTTYTILIAVIQGILLGFVYYYYKANNKYPFLHTVLIHASYNLYAFLLSEVFKIA